MVKYNKLLVVIDPTVEGQKALARGLLLAEKTGASVTAFLSIYDFSYEMTTMLSVEERETMRQAVVDERTEWLTDLVEQQTENNSVSIDVKVVWHNRPFESIIVETMENHYDLIIKGTHDHGGLKSVIFTPTDWHLLRKAPVPVLMVKEHDWPEDGQILAAVNVGTDDANHQSLNLKVAQTAKAYGETLKGQVTLVNSYPGTPVNIAIEIPEFNPSDFNESVKKHHEDSMIEFAEQQAMEVSQCIVKEGLPEDVLPQVANELDAELVVIGTVGRLGISAALIGNTAEHVIDSLNCDVLAVKPEGFVSPVKL